MPDPLPRPDQARAKASLQSTLLRRLSVGVSIAAADKLARPGMNTSGAPPPGDGPENYAEAESPSRLGAVVGFLLVALLVGLIVLAVLSL